MSTSTMRSRHFLSQTLWHFHKNTRSCVENECCCPRTVNISNDNFTLKISIPPEQVFKNMRQQMSGPDCSISWSIRHESEGWGFESPSGRDIFCLKNFDTFTRTPVRVSKMNAVARAKLTYQMINLLQRYIYHQNQCSKTWYSKCLALIVQWVTVFGMNPKVGGSSPLRSRHFLSQWLWHFYKNTRSCVKNECCCPRTVNISNDNFSSKISIPPEPVFKNMGQQMSGPDCSIG